MKRIMNKIDYDFWWEKIADYAKLMGRTNHYRLQSLLIK